MPAIKISRKKEWAIHSVPFEVFLDGQKIGYLSKGETREFDIPTGEHKIRVKTGRYGSKDFNYTTFNKESKSLVVSRNWVMVYLPHLFVLIFILVRFFILKGTKLRFAYQIEPWILLLIIASLFLLGRDYYLILREEK